ncbi:MAG TPA: TerC family protein, partial [Firmicutes bacterium]|nr:TerC family protein [Bacillota bacterium]
MENNFVPSEKLNLWQPLRKVLLFIGLAMLFNLGVLFFKGSQAALEFLGGYLIEFSLSLDNLFVFISIFTAFGISEHAEHRVLTYGIMGAVILRLIFISLGVQVVNHFHFILYIFGAVLIINGIKMFFQKEHEYDVKNHKMMRFLRRFVPMTEEMVGEKFFVKIDGKRMITPLFAVLMIIEG